MKAYQLKLSIHGVKPPIWRRIIVPAGLTFAQLSVIFAEAMNRQGQFSGVYGFPKAGITVHDGADDAASTALSATDTYIDAWMNEKERFSYTVAPWTYDGIVEAVLEDYDLAYPTISKGRSAYPPVDCAGPAAFASLQQAQPEQWQPYWWDAAALETLNGRFQEAFFLIETASERRSTAAISKDMAAGTYGLYHRQPKRSKQQHDAKVLRQVQADIQAAPVEDVVTVETILQDYTKDDLQLIAAHKGIDIKATWRKDKLISVLADAMVAALPSYFLCLKDGEIQSLKRAIAAKGAYVPKDDDTFSTVANCLYVKESETGYIVVPEVVRQAFMQWNSPQTMKERRRMNWLLQCLSVGNILYGIMPVDVLVKLYNRHPKWSIGKKEVLALWQRIPQDLDVGKLSEGEDICSSMVLQGGGALVLKQRQQGLGRFYIPTRDEIETGFFGNIIWYAQPAMVRAVKAYLRQIVQHDVWENALRCFLLDNVTCAALPTIMDHLSIAIQRPLQAGEIRELTALLQQYQRQVRRQDSCGFFFDELLKRR